MTQFKDKSAKLTQANGTESIPAGLLVYPPLMAADILLYDTNIVPVGADQKQHVEITRNIAERFNNKYGKTFVIPEPLIEEDHGKINDLQDPTKKMSKSAKNHNGVIFLNDTKEEVTAKIKSALTDNFNSVKYDPKNQPAVSNLVLIYHLISGMSIDQIENKYRGIKNYGEFKKDLTTIVVDFLTDFQSKYAAAKKNIKSIMKQIMENTKVVSSIADKKVNLVYKRIGLR
jgi:tryptophanyl-tRNA synthetase